MVFCYFDVVGMARGDLFVSGFELRVGIFSSMLSVCDSNQLDGIDFL